MIYLIFLFIEIFTDERKLGIFLLVHLLIFSMNTPRAKSIKRIFKKINIRFSQILIQICLLKVTIY